MSDIEQHVKTCEVFGPRCTRDDCPLTMCGTCGESWPCAASEDCKA